LPIISIANPARTKPKDNQRDERLEQRDSRANALPQIARFEAIRMADDLLAGIGWHDCSLFPTDGRFAPEYAPNRAELNAKLPVHREINAMSAPFDPRRARQSFLAQMRVARSDQC
jgi:hypothetical protein